MSTTDPRDLILIGHVIRPQGLTGLLRIVSYAQSEETFLQAGSVFILSARNKPEERGVISVKPQGRVYLLKLAGLNSAEQAENFRGAELFIPKHGLTRDEGEYFYHELVGLNVYLVNGHYLGVLKKIFPTGSNDVYVVENQGKEFLIPAIHQVVREIHVAEKKMIISPLKGLLDLE